MAESREQLVRDVTKEMRRWGRTAAKRILDGINKFGVVFSTYENGERG